MPIIKDFFDLIQKFLYNLCYKNITIEEGSQIYKCMKFYIAKNCKTFNGLVISDKSLECSNYLSHKHLGIVSIAEGKYYINYKSNIISVSVEEEKINIACLAYKEFKILLEFLEYTKTIYDKLYSDNISIYKYGEECGYWRCFTKVKKRSFNTIILPKDTKQLIYDDINKYLNNKAFYAKIGVTYKRTILLYSEPGCGKSSCITAMSNLLNINNIYSVNLKDPNALQNINRIPENTIIVFEDIDRYFKAVRNNQDNSIITWEPDFDIAVLINYLDGICTPEDTYIIITANNIDILPDVLLRSGRIDIKIKFDFCTREQIMEYAQLFYENISLKLLNKLGDCITIDKNITMSKIQQIFIKNIDDPYKAYKDIENL